ncbi:MAG: family 20 glycosylhydrolase [Microbacteriaceae bacterium]
MRFRSIERARAVLAVAALITATVTLGGCAARETKAEPRAAPQTGVMLDVARTYYPVDVIEGFIDVLEENGGDFLHLHLTDDENVGIESAVLGQTRENADCTAGVCTSRITGRPFLTTIQASEIIDYADARGIDIVPEVDTPGHMAAAFALLESTRGTEWVNSLRASESELDISQPQSRALAVDLYREVLETFPGSPAVHIGGDEWGSDVAAIDRVAWLNDMARALEGREVWAWNDGIEREFASDLAAGIRVTYWSFDGDTENSDESRERRQTRASADDLQHAGVDLLNYNSYYLYEVPTNLDPMDSDYTVDDLRDNWTLSTWDADSGSRLDEPMSGAAVAIWGEELEVADKNLLLRWSAPHIVAMIEKAHS